jgi:hypothetical protein
MTVKNNPVLGTIVCGGCNGQATVHAAKRGRGCFLYTRCTECGVDQRTGAQVQTAIFKAVEWRADVEPVRPPNLIEVGTGSEKTEEAKAADWVPEPEDNKNEESTGGGLWFVALGLGVLGAVVGLAR